MLNYLKSLDDIQVPQNDDLAPFELMAHIFDNKVYEYNQILQEATNQNKIHDKLLGSTVEC